MCSKSTLRIITLLYHLIKMYFKMRIKILFLLTILLNIVLPAYSQFGGMFDFVDDGGNEYECSWWESEEETTCDIRLKKLKTPNLTVPKTVKDLFFETSYDVTSFKGAGQDIVSLTVPPTIQSVNCYNCKNLTSVSIPGLKNIEYYAFRNCTSLKSVYAPQVSYVGEAAFKDCSVLTDINLPEVRIVSAFAFEGCSSLSTIEMPKAIGIGWQAFKSCKSLTAVSFPNVIVIDEHAFEYCEYLTNVALPSAVQIGNFTFEGCKSLTNVIIPNVEYIYSGTFKDCSALTDIILPKAKQIEYEAFLACPSLTSVYMPSVLDISTNAFKDCESLTTVYMPNAINIGKQAFRNCKSLNCIDMKNAKFINNEAFYGCESLIDAYIPNVEEIGQSAFSNCGSLKSVFLSKAKKIGNKAFDGSRLESIIVDNENPPSLVNKPFLWTIYETAELIVPWQAIEAYKNSSWGSFFHIRSLMENYAFTDFLKEGILRDEKVSGVTADGKTQLVIMTKDFDPNISFIDYSIITKINGESINDKRLTGEVGQLRNMRTDDEIGFVYTAPNGYAGPKNSNSYILDIELISKNNKHRLNARVEVWRPGVLLLHGLNSDLTCWREASSFLLGSGAYNASQVVNYSYKNSNRESFDENTHKNKVVDKGLSTLFARLLSEGILSSKYDIVGHSMGGILARKYAQEVNPDGVNRIITFNTPHSGSQFGDIFNIDNKISDLPNLPNLLSLKISTLFSHDNAIYDLGTKSQAMKVLNDPSMVSLAEGIPVHAACTAFEEMGLISNAVYQVTYGPVSLPIWMFGFSAPNKGRKLLNDILDDEQNDGVVSLKSQQGGLLIGTTASILKDDYSGILGSFSDAHHCNMTNWNKNHERLLTLLQASKDDFRFAKSFSPVNLGKSRVKMPNYKEKASTKSTVENGLEPSVKISLEKQKEDNREVTVRISSTDDVVTIGAFCVIDKDRIILNDYEAESTFSIPYDFVGTLDFIAVGYTEEGEWLTDTESLEFNTVATPTYIRIENIDPLKILCEESVELQVLAFWPDGQSTTVDADYKIIGGKDIVNIVDGVLTGVSEGECTIEATYRGMTHTITVGVQKASVVEAGVNGIMTSPNSGMTMFRRNSTLVVKLSEYYEGSLYFRAYLPDGRLISMDTVDGMFTEGEEITFNLPVCDDNFIIVTCSRDDERISVMKITN